VLVVLNDEIHAARNVTKTNTTSLQTFVSPNRGPLGLVHTAKISWFPPPDKRHTTRSEFSVKDVTSLPRVDIIFAHSNMGADLIEAAHENDQTADLEQRTKDQGLALQRSETRASRPMRRVP